MVNLLDGPKEINDIININKVNLMLPVKEEDSAPSESEFLTLAIENMQNFSEPERIPICHFFQMGC